MRKLPQHSDERNPGLAYALCMASSSRSVIHDLIVVQSAVYRVALGTPETYLLTPFTDSAGRHLQMHDGFVSGNSRVSLRSFLTAWLWSTVDACFRQKTN